MFFLSLSSLIFNIAHPDMHLRAIFGDNCLLFQDSGKRAYLPESKHIEACKSEYVKDCGIWSDNYQRLQQPNSRFNKWKIAILK